MPALFLTLIATFLATFQLHSSVITCDFRPMFWQQIQLDYINDIKELLKTFQSDNVNAQERNSLIDKTIESLDNTKIQEYPSYLLHNLAVRIKNDLFEKNPLILSQPEKDIFIHKLLDIVEKTEWKYIGFKQEFYPEKPIKINN